MTEQEYNIAVKTLSHRLFGYVFKSLRNREDSNDIVQESFMKLWINREKVETPKAKSWLFTTAHNALINFVKKRGRMSSLDALEIDRGKEDKNEFELKEIIDKALAVLPEQHKSILLLRDYEGYNYKEIGEIMNLNESQVKVYLFRARQKVKEQIKDLTILKD
ncbi:MAG: RNA polymerase sigma factor (sigma-70 family) [Saprospiraceae bacterium]